MAHDVRMVIGRRNDWWVLLIPGLLLVVLAALIPATDHPERACVARVILLVLGLAPVLIGVVLGLRRSYAILDRTDRTVTHGWSLLGRMRLDRRPVVEGDRIVLTRVMEGLPGREFPMFHVMLEGIDDTVPLRRLRDEAAAHALAERAARHLDLPMDSFVHALPTRRLAGTLDDPAFVRAALLDGGAPPGDLPDVPASSVLSVDATDHEVTLRVGPLWRGAPRVRDTLVLVVLFAALGWGFAVAPLGLRILVVVLAFALVVTLVELVAQRKRFDIVRVHVEGVDLEQRFSWGIRRQCLDPRHIEQILLARGHAGVLLRTDADSVKLPGAFPLRERDARLLRELLLGALCRVHGAS